MKRIDKISGMGRNRLDAVIQKVIEGLVQQIDVQIVRVADLCTAGIGMGCVGRLVGRERAGRPTDIEWSEIRTALAVPGKDAQMRCAEKLVSAGDRKIGKPCIDRHHAQGMTDIEQEDDITFGKCLRHCRDIELLAGQ